MSAAPPESATSIWVMSEVAGLRGTPAPLPLSSLIGKLIRVAHDFGPTVCGSVHSPGICGGPR